MLEAAPAGSSDDTDLQRPPEASIVSLVRYLIRFRPKRPSGEDRCAMNNVTTSATPFARI